jgi:integrase
LPAVRGRRDRVAAPHEAAALLDALAPRDRLLWATATYAGLRRGELQALRWGDVDLDAAVIVSAEAGIGWPQRSSRSLLRAQGAFRFRLP